MRLFGQEHYEILCEPRVLRRLTTLFMHPVVAHLAPPPLPSHPLPPLLRKTESSPRRSAALVFVRFCTTFAFFAVLHKTAKNVRQRSIVSAKDK